MSLSHETDIYETPTKRTDRKHREYSFVLTLICLALALVVAGVIFTPVTIGSGISNETSLVGP